MYGMPKQCVKISPVMNCCQEIFDENKTFFGPIKQSHHLTESLHPIGTKIYPNIWHD